MTKGLPDPLFSGKIVFPRDLADGAVGGDDDADGGVIPDDLAGAGLGGKVKGDCFLKPGAFDHAGLFILLVAHGPLHHVAHTVDEAHPALAPALQCQRHCRFRDELGLGGHDGLAGRALRQLIPAQVAQVLILHCREHQQLHEPLYEGRFACADRPYYAYVNLSACSRLNILVYIKIVHKYTPLLCFYSICRGA